jgi:hypothetical protein
MNQIVFLLSLSFQLSTFTQSGTISGRILACGTEEPLSGAEVRFYSIRAQADSIDVKLAKSTRTDEHGNYEVKLDTGRYLVKALVPGFLPASAWDIVISESESRILDLSLIVVDVGDYAPGFAPSHDIVGQIVSVSKEPIPDATVIARDVDNFNPILEVRSDNSGKFILKLIRGGRFLVYAEKPGFNLSTPAMVETARNSQQLEIILSPLQK